MKSEKNPNPEKSGEKENKMAEITPKEKRLPLYRTPSGRKSPKLARIKNKISKIEDEQAPVRKKLGPKLSERVTDLLSTGRFPAIVSGENGFCGGCSGMIPPQTLRDIRHGAIVECEHCSRLLYFPE